MTKDKQDIPADNSPEAQLSEPLTGGARQSGKDGWYVIHTYAGYEDQVAESIRQRAETLKLQEYIFEVIVPKEKQIEIKNGKRRVVEKRSFPGYVFVRMIVTDESWYVVRNTPSVTGFLGSGVRPTPIPESEVATIKAKMAIDEPEHTVDLRTGDLVRITDGPLKGYEGKITEVDPNKGRVKVSVSMFGRETPVTLDFLQVKKI
jgi:transcription termination/antitermination protein NusG